MRKLSFSKPIYHTYDDGKKTLCIYNCSVLHDGTPINTFKVMGKAYCSDDDTPDARIGRIIADSKAKIQAYKRAKIGAYDLEQLKKCINYMLGKLEFHNKMSYLLKSEEEHLNKLCNYESNNNS